LTHGDPLCASGFCCRYFATRYVTWTFNSQFAARSAFHLVKWFSGVQGDRAPTAEGLNWPALLMLQRIIGPRAGQFRGRVLSCQTPRGPGARFFLAQTLLRPRLGAKLSGIK